MVDFNKLRKNKPNPRVIEPIEIFRRLPKPVGINDLYTSQAAALEAWFSRRTERDTVVKLHTGGGKTLVGLLMAQSTLNETREPVLYLTPTVQLVKQAIERAKAHGIEAVPYETGAPLHEGFLNSNAVMIATYKALFNGRSKFGIRGTSNPQSVGAVILDDAHSAFSVIRESFTIEVDREENPDRYENLTGLFRQSFKDLDKLGTFDDIVAGHEYSVLEVPYWAWHEKHDAVLEQLKSDSAQYGLIWPLLRDRLNMCHALISKSNFTITSVLPIVNAFPTFADCARRIYMSATIADDSEIVRTFDASSESVSNPITSRSLAGISERMILVPDLMPFAFEQKSAEELVKWVAKNKQGAVVLVPSDNAADSWSQTGEVAKGSKAAENLIERLQQLKTFGPAIFSNRYDGVDLPGDSCRLLVMSGLPTGTSNYELYRAGALHGGSTITRLLAQRIEQGIGRGARGSSDHCVVLLSGSDLSSWVAKDANFRFLTSATRAQLEIGIEISKEVADLKDLGVTIKKSTHRDSEWISYHAETLADLVEEKPHDEMRLEIAIAERKAYSLWMDGYSSEAIAKLEKLLSTCTDIDAQTKGWLQQLAAKIADQWGNKEKAQDLQREAFGNNKNLLRPKVAPPYISMDTPMEQAEKIVTSIGGYRIRRGFIKYFDEAVSNLNKSASANQFEQSLTELGNFLGFSAERHDENGKGPDVLWLLPNRSGIVIEAKSRKKDKNALNKDDHGQLLIAAEWFKRNYPDYNCVRVSVLARNVATSMAEAGASHALTYESLASLISDARALLSGLCESQLDNKSLLFETQRRLDKSKLTPPEIVQAYFLPFE